MLAAPSSATEDFHGLTALPGGGFVTLAHDGAAVDKMIAWRGGQRTILVDTKGQDLVAPMYSGTGHLLYQRLSSGELWAVPFDQKSLSVTGESFLLLQSGGYPSVSTDGRVLVATVSSGRGESEIVLATVDAATVYRIPAEIPFASYANASLSADGKRVAVVSAKSGIPSAWTYPVGPGLAMQVTDGTPVASISFMPDDASVIVVYGSQWCLSGDCFSIARRPLGGGTGTSLAKGWSPDVSRDGRTLIYSKRSETEWDLAFKSLDGSGEPQPFQGGPGWQFGARFSPDGRYVAYTSTEAGRGEVYVARFPAGDKRRVTSDGGYWPRWSRDGKRLYYSHGTGLSAVEVSTAAGFSIGTPVQIFPQGALSQIAGTRWPTPFDVSADGTRFLIARSLPRTEPSKAAAHVLLNMLPVR